MGKKGRRMSKVSYYRIRDWEKHFENNRTREMDKMRWVPVPNKHDGEGFQRIMQEKDGIIIYGCWHLILQVASKMPVRGTLLREDRTPITADVLALKTGWRNPRDFTRALDFCSSTQMLWIELLAIEGAEIPQSTAEIPHEGARNGMEWNGMEVKGSEPLQREKGLAGMVDAIRTCRHEYKVMNPVEIENVLKACPAELRANLEAAVYVWTANQESALKPFDNPLASLRKAVERVVDPLQARRSNADATDKGTTSSQRRTEQRAREYRSEINVKTL